MYPVAEGQYCQPARIPCRLQPQPKPKQTGDTLNHPCQRQAIPAHGKTTSRFEPLPYWRKIHSGFTPMGPRTMRRTTPALAIIPVENISITSYFIKPGTQSQEARRSTGTTAAHSGVGASSGGLRVLRCKMVATEHQRFSLSLPRESSTRQMAQRFSARHASAFQSSEELWYTVIFLLRCRG